MHIRQNKAKKGKLHGKNLVHMDIDSTYKTITVAILHVKDGLVKRKLTRKWEFKDGKFEFLQE